MQRGPPAWWAQSEPLAAATATRLREAEARLNALRPKLCLHFDVNETIMVGDPAGGDSFEDCLHKMLCKNAFVRRAIDGECADEADLAAWVWHDGSPLDPAKRDPAAPPPPLLPEAWEPPAGCVAFYKVSPLKKAYAKSFAKPGSPGSIYAPELERLRAAMRWPPNTPPDARLVDAEGYYKIMPAFFHTLASLREAGRPFAVVIRTFGTDLPRVVSALDAFCDGAHPLWPGLTAPELKLPPERMWRGRYSEDGSFMLGTGDVTDGGRGLGGEATATDGREAIVDEAAAAAELQGGAEAGSGRQGRLPLVSAVQDDYHHWADAGYAPSAGKPLWLTLSDGGWQHIFFDDNIHNDADDSIVAVRCRPDAKSPFAPVSGEGTRQLQGSVLKRTPTLLPILEHGWFLRSIGECEARLEELKRKGKGGLLARLGGL